MKSILKTVFLLGFLLFFSCKKSTYIPLDEAQKSGYLQLGDSIATEMQKVLLQNVSSAIQQGGPEYAVTFCNTQAMPLTDSISKKYDVQISRLSDKNRNPMNALESSRDRISWEKIKSDKKDFVIQESAEAIYYYKPIAIGMPTCLQCHGGTSDIAQETMDVIKLNYPNDKAVGYQTGDLRGMWKIEFNLQ